MFVSFFLYLYIRYSSVYRLLLCKSNFMQSLNVCNMYSKLYKICNTVKYDQNEVIIMQTSGCVEYFEV